MATYRALLSEHDFLKVQLRARAVWKNGIVLKAIYYKENEIMFQTRSVTEPGIIYTERVQLTDLAIEDILKAKKFREIENMIKNGNIKVYCSCPAFLYWGYKYMAWRKGYGLEKETRAPKIRNPYERGWVCKHLYALMQIFPLLARPIASKYKKWITAKVEWAGTRESNYFGQRGVRTDLTKNETLNLKDSVDTVINDEPLITADDIVNDNVETVQPFDEPIVDSGDIKVDALTPTVQEYESEGVTDTGNGFEINDNS